MTRAVFILALIAALALALGRAEAFIMRSGGAPAAGASCPNDFDFTNSCNSGYIAVLAT